MTRSRTHLGISGGGDLDSASIEDFLVEDDDGGMPRKDASDWDLHDSELAGMILTICRRSVCQRAALTLL